MIGVAMRDEHRIEPLQFLSQGLLAEVRRSIDEHRLPTVLDQDRNAQTLITRITEGTLALDPMDGARRCAVPKKVIINKSKVQGLTYKVKSKGFTWL